MPDETRILTGLVLLFALAAFGEQGKRPARFWTPAEQKEYEACLPHSREVWKTPKETEDYCLINTQHKRWLHVHRPEITGKKEIQGAMHQCLEQNKAKINGTWTEFRTAFDGCMRESYGLSGN